jgi:hypothetical protein
VAIERRNLINSPIIIPQATSPSGVHASTGTSLNQPKQQLSQKGPLTLSNSNLLLAPVEPTSSTIMKSLNAEKSKKRTPARAQKLIADIFLLAGRADIAQTRYLTCIESMKQSGDFLWQAAALEGYHSATLAVTLRKCGVLVIISRRGLFLGARAKLT